MNLKISIPLVPLDEARRWRTGNGWLYQEKMDGRFGIVRCRLTGTTTVGEHVADGRFVAFDLVQLGTEDIRNWPLRERWRALKAIHNLPAMVSIVPAVNGGEGLEAVLAAGGEGVVAKDLSSPYGMGLWKAKRQEVFYCAVTELNQTGRQTVRLGLLPSGLLPSVIYDLRDFQPGADTPLQDLPDAGWMPLRGTKFDRVRVGSVLKVEAHGRHPSGLLREARPDQDTPDSWLVRW